jgi:hypothetical protein
MKRSVDMAPSYGWTIANYRTKGTARCPQAGTILEGYPPLPLPGELPRWLPNFQPWITRINPSRGQLEVGSVPAVWSREAKA